MSTFNFTWNSDNKTPKGKVFARKRKPTDEATKTTSKPSLLTGIKNNNPNKNDSTPFRITKTSANTNANLKSKDILSIDATAHQKIKSSKNLINTKKTSPFTPRFQEKTFEGSAKLVKRKRKKDKTAAKTDAEEGTINNPKQNQTVQTTQRSQTHSLFAVGHKDVYINTNIKGKSIVEKVFSTGKKFGDLEIHKYLVSNLEKIHYTSLTNVQEKSIPEIMSGKNVLIRSQTGSGKTLAYAVPIIDALQSINPRIQRNNGVQAIVVVPTRELALQTHELFGKINTFQWIVVGHLCGGENRNTEKTRLRKGIHVLIATPGRLLDHILHTAAFKTNNIRCLVLDEADRLLDMGFKRDIIRIVEELDKAKTNSEYDPISLLKGKTGGAKSEVTIRSEETFPLRDPSSNSRQTVLLSATLTKGIAELADFAMKDHIYVDALDESATVNPEHMVIPNTVKQKFIVTHVKHRLFTLSALLISKAQQSSKVFVFMATSQMVDYHYELFTRCLVKMPKNRGKLKSGDIVLLDDVVQESDDDDEVVLDIEFFKLHGSMDQASRKDVFTRFRSAKKGVLLCTDVAARGIDVPTADCIVQYTGPQSDEDYIHRVGRTGRAGKSGFSFIFLTHEEQDFVTRLQEHKVFLQQHDPDDFLNHLSVLMEEPDHQNAATALQRRYENALSNDKDLHKLACLAYTSWSRFYNTYSSKMRSIFDFKNVNLGHYVASFGLKETPTEVAGIIRGQMAKVERPRLNRKLAIHEDDQPKRPAQKRKIKSVSLTTSEYASGLAPNKKRKKKKDVN
ncbi:probable ATP-dependent RNA helicase CG8611 [Anoplophora glabripennis]|uniref:probable ATP-dependent RNA helicase CG8611 n=1 Tax=Anoplophora glabripennis TaxID=217634 RepID=UPI00087546E6|nr:probable ATP-dependent RNA helicase CG8611 [Anoplophora glabripennis]